MWSPWEATLSITIVIHKLIFKRSMGPWTIVCTIFFCRTLYFEKNCSIWNKQRDWIGEAGYKIKWVLEVWPPVSKMIPSDWWKRWDSHPLSFLRCSYFLSLIITSRIFWYFTYYDVLQQNQALIQKLSSLEEKYATERSKHASELERSAEQLSTIRTRHDMVMISHYTSLNKHRY